MKLYFAFVSFIFLTISIQAQSIFKGDGQAAFISDAPLEIIKAESEELTGIVDLSNMNFAFKINIASFEGFNSALQKEHFNEHYLETQQYPDATFLGKILLEEDCVKNCEVKAVCKGKLNIHGITQIVTIPVLYKLNENTLHITGQFKILLSDYNIKIPRIVQAKISPEIDVNVEIEMLYQP